MTPPKSPEQILALLAEIESAVKHVGTELDGYVHPVRDSVLKRYPVLFALLVSLGVASTVLGLEQLLLELDLFTKHPGLLFLLGVGILIVTGSLYKKLG
jgi:hypothetical protein